MTLLKGRTFIVLVLLVIFFTIVKGTTFLSASTLTMVAKHVALYGILALGMTFVIITGGIDLSVGSVVGLVGMLAGGIGSALSDLIGGYFVYVPITLVIKGLVALVSGLIYQKMCRYGKNRYVAVILGGIFEGLVGLSAKYWKRFLTPVVSCLLYTSPSPRDCS